MFTVTQEAKSGSFLNSSHELSCVFQYALSNQKNCGNRLQAILLIKFNKLELSNNQINSLKVNLQQQQTNKQKMYI